MIRRNSYSNSSRSCQSDESSKKSCYVCEKIKKRPKKKDNVIYVQKKQDECESSHCFFFSEPNLTPGLRFMGLGSSGPVFANGSYVICNNETVRRMCVVVKDVGATIGFNIQFTLIYARADANNNYSSGLTQTHISTIIQIPASTVPQTRCAEITVNPSICLRQCDLIGIQINPTDTSVHFQATASVCG